MGENQTTLTINALLKTRRLRDTSQWNQAPTMASKRVPGEDPRLGTERQEHGQARRYRTICRSISEIAVHIDVALGEESKSWLVEADRYVDQRGEEKRLYAYLSL
jgi:hypothetical protein